MDAPVTKPVAGKFSTPRFIYITGCDGTGKTTQARLLLEQLQAQGVRARHVWLRFPFTFSLPLLAYARLRGYSWYENESGFRHGYWDFQRSWLMREIFPWALLLDAALAAIRHIYVPLWRGEIIVCERFALDMLVDLSVATGETGLINQLPGRLFLRLLPARSQMIILDLDAPMVRCRRPDLSFDHRLDERLAAYRQLSAGLKIAPFSSRQPVEAIHCEIARLTGAGYAHS
jgi:thymidylate kinase